MATDVSIRLGVTGERDLTAALKGVESRIKNQEWRFSKNNQTKNS